MEEIGRRLRAAREAKGIALEQAEEDTKIRRKYLQALEAAREADIPGEVYLKGFLRTYGNYLGLDGPALVEEYKRNKFRATMEQLTSAERPEGGAKPGAKPAAAPAPDPVPPQIQQSPSPAAEPPQRVRRSPVERETPQPAGPRELSGARRTARTQRGRPHNGPSRMLRRTLTLVVLVCVVGAAGWAAYRQFGSGPAATPPAAPGTEQQQPAVQQPQQTAQEPAPPAEGGQTKPAAQQSAGVTMEQGTGNQILFRVPASDVQVRIEFGAERVWLSAEADGKMLFSGTLKEGAKESMEFKGKHVEVNMGHMNGTSLVVNGQRFETPLESGPYVLVFQAQQ